MKRRIKMLTAIKHETARITNFNFVTHGEVDDMVRYKLTIEGYLTEDILKLVKYISTVPDNNKATIFAKNIIKEIDGIYL